MAVVHWVGPYGHVISKAMVNITLTFELIIPFAYYHLRYCHIAFQPHKHCMYDCS